MFMHDVRYDANAHIAREPTSPSFARTIVCTIWTHVGPTSWIVLFEHDRIYTGLS